MRRREFIAGLAGAASVWPRTARAQRRPKPLIGFFSPNSPFIARPWTAAFVDRLSELGWVEDRTVAIVYRWGEGRTEHAANKALKKRAIQPVGTSRSSTGFPTAMTAGYLRSRPISSTARWP